MSMPEDPLFAHVQGEAERMERAVDRRYERRGGLARLRLPPTETSPTHETAFTWRYRFTWQEAERSRRYVISLPVDRCIAAREAVEERIASWLAGRDVTVRVVGPTVAFREVSQSYEVTSSVRLSERHSAATDHR